MSTSQNSLNSYRQALTASATVDATGTCDIIFNPGTRGEYLTGGVTVVDSPDGIVWKCLLNGIQIDVTVGTYTLFQQVGPGDILELKATGLTSNIGQTLHASFFAVISPETDTNLVGTLPDSGGGVLATLTTISGAITTLLSDRQFTNSPFTFSGPGSQNFAPPGGSPTFNSLIINFVAGGGARYWGITVTGINSGIQYVSFASLSNGKTAQYAVSYSNLIDPSGVTVTASLSGSGGAPTLECWVVGSTFPLTQRNVYGNGVPGPVSSAHNAVSGGSAVLYGGTNNVRIYAAYISANGAGSGGFSMSCGGVTILAGGYIANTAMVPLTLSHPSGLLIITSGGINPIDISAPASTFVDGVIWYSEE